MKLIIADDSAVIRAILDQNLARIGGFEVIASVSNGRRAINSSRSERPDAIISDIDMPELDGISALKTLAGELHIPVLILSEDASAKTVAVQAGASAFLVKPALSAYNEQFFSLLTGTLSKIASSSNTCSCGSAPEQACATSAKPGAYKILCIGASTGGPSAVAEVLQGLGPHFPLPVLYTQHIEVGADKNMAKWFDSTCQNITVALAQDGDETVPGKVYMAPADHHLSIDFVKPNGRAVLRVSDEEPERFLRPAVNKLFRSAAKHYKKACLSVLLTGMGRDGAEGCKAIRDAGGWTIAEDKSTCAVFGMPAAAIEIGGACEVLPRNQIAGRICQLVRSPSSLGAVP